MPKPPSAFYPEIPRLLARPLTLLPFPAQQLALTNILQTIFKELITSGDCNFLRNRWLRVGITDLNINWFFSLDMNDRIVMKSTAKEDASICGNINEFILLAARKEDPDTLFFQRRLLIEGDTELSLEVKNMIDALDINTLSKELRFLMNSAGEFVDIFSN